MVVSMPRARTTTSHDERSAATRAALVAAAGELFAERGYGGASVALIGERAGISRGSIFWHFGSKEGLLWAVVDDAFDAWRRGGLMADVGDAVGRDAVRRALESHRRFLESGADRLRLYFLLLFEALGPRAEIAPRFAALYAAMREDTSTWIAAGQRAGELRDDVDPAIVVSLITATLAGLAQQHLLDPGAIDLDRAYGDLLAVLDRGLAT